MPLASSKLSTSLFTFPSKPPPPIISFLLFLILCILGFYSLHHPRRLYPAPLSENSEKFLSMASNSTISDYLRSLTSHSHLAGTKPSLDTIQYVFSHFENLGLEAHSVEYNTLLSYPQHVSLLAHFSDRDVVDFLLTEKGVPQNAFSDIVQPYHAYSPSGSAFGKVVFVNYGREEDYGALEVMGVNVSGCVVIARKGESLSRGGVIKIAEDKGALGVLLYAERDISRSGGVDGVERGTVMRGVGDPLSPGWAGVEDGESLDLKDNEVLKRFPKIPSLPLSFENAQTILESLAGGFMPQSWGNLGRINGGRVGPGPTLVNLTYQGEEKVATIHNVFAVLRGFEEPDRYVLLGNHRDAWTYGAVDPNSGTAALLDIARRYAMLMQKGWTPRRTIIFCSWDAEEFGMVGSTEWVEQNIVNLGAKAVAYLNVDCAVQGPGFFAGSTPQLDDLLIEVTKNVKDPDSDGSTAYDQWAATNGVVNIQRLSGVDSDFAPFVQHAGVPSVDVYYGRDFPVYHTAFDSYAWMVNHADPFFQRHVAVAGVWGLLALRLADDAILPFNYLSYANQLQAHKDILSNLVDESISLDPLTMTIQELKAAAKEAEVEAKRLIEKETIDHVSVLKVRALNDRLMLAERGFLDSDGLIGRKWFKHLIYGPPSDYESKLNFFPGIADAISQSRRMSERDGQALIQHEVWRVARAIQRAANALRGGLT
ncbi:probable glutamate carboxypeptidase AMP1 isoform X2 [Mangifera indica]|uniref:probable glutamate carboxypeptidase AMP1 isoform X2 n=1 Tax=Mangifera indica TaxID=29780 RepID=UPI001CFB7DD6|nr:probable glutamate carboxypeptidase AMP1 isoform X2 [Mangifera indica]